MKKPPAEKTSAGSFFCLDRLNLGKTCFGYVTDGMDVVDAVCEAAQPTDGNGTIPADQQPVITAIRVID